MNGLWRVAVGVTVVLWGGAVRGIAADPDPAAEDAKPELTVAQQIQRQIPAASAVSRKDFERLASMPAVPKPSEFSDQSLTLVLMFSGPYPKQGKRHFRSLPEGVAKPYELAAEMHRTTGIGRLRIPLGPCTLIHADRITDLTCKVDGDTAKGTVSFRVPKLYEGKVDYEAHRRGEVWRIETFLLPGYGQKVVRGEKGPWKVVELEPKPK
ncbi:MAG: hypothetical protein HQ567_05590 [Candidatus Nealsonbacteria bacterium]|nr:hypothetical protein [Candidatus Nealsonbacteria bacterium]